MKKVYFYTLITLLILLGIGALAGGGAMIIDPSGQSIQMPLSLLENSLFKDFLIPGIVLFILFGLIPILLIKPLLKGGFSRFFESINIFTDMQWPWSFVIYISFALIIWIQVQMEIIRDITWIHTLYTIWAIFMIGLALMPGVRSRLKKQE